MMTGTGGAPLGSAGPGGDGGSNDETVGRERELAALGAAADRARRGRPTTVVIVGDAGMGKTSLLRAITADEGAVVVSATGDESEAGLDYAVLDQLVRSSPLGHEARASLLPLEGTDPLRAGATLLAAIDESQLERLLVVAVDDAHWSDRASLQALTFAARRLRADPVLLLVTCRPEGMERLPAGLLKLAGEAGGSVLRLDGLDAAAIARIAGRAYGRAVAPAVAERLRAHTGGNPLHLRTLVDDLSYDVVASPSPLPAPASYAVHVLSRVATCREPARRLVRAIAVLGPHATVGEAAAVAELSDPLAAIDEAVAHGFVEVIDEPGRRSLAFTHPLVRAAILDDMAPLQRASLHRTAGGVVEGTAGLRHRLASVNTTDADLAAQARAAAIAAAAGGSHSSAASLLLEAARVAPDPSSRTAAELDAVDELLAASDLDQLRLLRPRVTLAPDTPLRNLLLGRLAYVLGPRPEARAHAEKAWAQLTTPDGAVSDIQLAARVAGLLATTVLDEGDGAAGLEWAQRSFDLAGDDDADDNRGMMLAAGYAVVGRVGEGIDRLSARLAVGRQTGAAFADLSLGRGALRLWSHDLPGAIADFEACLDACGAGGMFVTRESARFYLAEALFRSGHWDEAIVTADLAASVVEETHQGWMAAFPHSVAVHVLAPRGDWARAAEHLAAAEGAAAASHGGAALLWATLAQVRLAESRHDHAAVVAVGDLFTAAGQWELDEGLGPWRAAYVGALVALGRLEDADAVLTAFARASTDSPSALVRCELARARVVVAAAWGDDRAVDAAAEAGIALGADAVGPFAYGRLELAAGQAWRRRGERRRAGDALDAARARFAALRAAPWVEIAEREIAACGRRTTRRGTGHPGETLTPQEEAVALLAARGRTNREIADELIISSKTVEHHLSRTYAKLRVRSRTEMAAVLGSQPDGTPMQS